MRGSTRNGPLLNGALIAVGLIGVLDNVVAHWVLRLHRLVPGPEADVLEPLVVVVSAGLLVLGLIREWQGRAREPS